MAAALAVCLGMVSCADSGATPEALQAALRDGTATTRLSTALTLEAGGAAALTALERALADNDWVVRAQALAVLGTLGEAAVDVVGPATADPQDEVRVGAVAALHTIGGSATVPWLMAALEDPSPLVLTRSLRALVDADGLAVADVAKVVDLIGHRSGKVRRWAGIVVVFVGGTAVPPLTAALEGDGNDRWRAAWALGQIGPRAATALPQLRAMTDDPDKRTRTEAALAIAAIEGDA
jgi:HEAT repeat protein